MSYIELYTDGQKTTIGAGIGVYSKQLRLNFKPWVIMQQYFMQNCMGYWNVYNFA